MVVAALLVLLTQGGCFIYKGRFDPLSHGAKFEEANKRFNRMLRWGQFDKAAVFVAPDIRDGFLAEAQKMSGLHFTDWELQVVDIDDDLERIHVEVLFKAYGPSLEEKTFGMIQKWERGGEEESAWRVRPQLAELRSTFRY